MRGAVLESVSKNAKAFLKVQFCMNDNDMPIKAIDITGAELTTVDAGAYLGNG